VLFAQQGHAPEHAGEQRDEAAGRDEHRARAAQQVEIEEDLEAGNRHEHQDRPFAGPPASGRSIAAERHGQRLPAAEPIGEYQQDRRTRHHLAADHLKRTQIGRSACNDVDAVDRIGHGDG
jgi:hypothetical protein